MAGDLKSDLEDGLAVRFVPARKTTPGVGRLELCGGDGVFVACVVGECAAVKAAQLVVQDAVERNDNLELATRHGCVNCQVQPFGLFVEPHSSGLHDSALAHRGFGDREFDRVEHNLGNRLVCGGLNRDRSAELCCLDVWPKADEILGWRDSPRQTMLVDAFHTPSVRVRCRRGRYQL